MTCIYDQPARPWAFGPFVSTDIVGQEAEALIQRYDLLDALTLNGCPRRDIIEPDKIDHRLREQMIRQLVSGVDLESDTGDGWPIRAGVRLEALCYSPWLDELRDRDGSIGGRQVFRAPEDAAEFARQFQIRSGISPDLDDAMRDVFGFTPTLLGEVALQVRGSDEAPSAAYRLLLSRHFEAALSLAPDLGSPHPLLEARGFRGPVIAAFAHVAEIARIGMIVGEVERHAHLTAAILRPMLEQANDRDFVAKQGHPITGVAFSQKIADALVVDPALLRLCEYLVTGTDVLASWRNAVTADRGTFIDGFRPAAALAGGSITADTAAALAWMVDVRSAFLSAMRPAPSERKGTRQSALDNDALFKFYGLSNWSNNIAAAIYSDFGARRRGGRPVAGTSAKHHDDVRYAQAAIVAALGRNPTRRGKLSLNGIPEGSRLSKLYLPADPVPGSAPRGTSELWRDRYRDQPFWEKVQDPDQRWLDGLDLGPDEKQALGSAMQALKGLARGLGPYRPSSLTAKIVSDLACAVSPISADPAFARAIALLVRFNADIVEKHHQHSQMSERRQTAQNAMRKAFPNRILGAREIPGIKGITARLPKLRPR